MPEREPSPFLKVGLYVCLAKIQPGDYVSGPRDRTSPDPYFVLVGWSSEPDSDGPFRPGDRVGLHQLLDTVLPQNPGLHRLWDGRGADRQMPHLLRLQAPGLTLGEAWTFGHVSRVSNRCSGAQSQLDDDPAT
jgi:hypothetical protein